MISIDISHLYYFVGLAMAIIGGIVSLVMVYSKLDKKNALLEQRLLQAEKNVDKHDEELAMHRKEIEEEVKEINKNLAEIKTAIATIKQQ